MTSLGNLEFASPRERGIGANVGLLQLGFQYVC